MTDSEPFVAFHKQPRISKPRRTKRLRAVSDKTAASFDLRAKLRRDVLARDGGCVLAGETDLECAGIDTVHHRRKASAGGAWSMLNLICLCAGHNVDIENRPAYYREGWSWLVVREGDESWDELGKRR